MNNETHLDRRSKYSMYVIRQALFELLETKTLSEITVVEICSKADVNRGTFYKYYRDIPDLYDKIEDSLAEKLYALISKPDASIHQKNIDFEEILKILAHNKEFTYIAQNPNSSQRLAQKLLTLFIPHLQQMLQRQCPNASRQDSDLLLEYILGGCIRVISCWLKNGMQISIEKTARTLSAMVSYSLSQYE